MGKQSEHWLKKPSSAAILWFLLTMLLVILSMFTRMLTDIQYVLEFNLSSYFSWTMWVIIGAQSFWLLLLATVVFVTYQRYLVGVQDNVNTEKMSLGIARLEELNRTLPPKKFAHEIASNYEQHYQAVGSLIASDGAPIADVKEYIRVLLDKINTLARIFDESEELYAINLMIYREIGFIKEAGKCTQKCVKFLNEPTLENCAGVLFLDQALSTNSRNGRAEADASVEGDMALPIYKSMSNDLEEQLKYLLPGAPKAYYTGQMDQTHNISELLEGCKNLKPDICDRYIRRKIETYFKKTQIKSFASLPVNTTKFEADQIKERCLGVVNIHKFSEGILRSHMTQGDRDLRKEAMTQFYYLTVPYLSLLPPLIEKIPSECNENCIP